MIIYTTESIHVALPTMDDDTEDNHLRDAWNQAVEEYEKATGKILKESKHEDLRKKCEQLEKTDHVTLIINSARQVVKVADLAAKAVPVSSHSTIYPHSASNQPLSPCRGALQYLPPYHT